MERLRRAAHQLRGQVCSPSTIRLRPEQELVVCDFAQFLEEAESRAPAQGGPLGRIILPPRTGKTVIAGALIGATGLRTTFVVPTRVLVNQTADLLANQLPGLPIARYFSEHKQLTDRGVNVVTYAILQRDMRLGGLPAEIRQSELVFFDEAHHTLSPERIELVRNGFGRAAIRVALTATPDWNESRTLCRLFPELIHEITLEQALELELLAPMRIWVAEVDADGSRVEIVAGDYDPIALGRIMSETPFFHAVMHFRYQAMNRGKPALIACVTRQQAYDLGRYLRVHRPAGSPPPAIIVGETSAGDREHILSDFEAGAVDTLIQVGVLIEGWTSPQCKLLVDLAPSRSLVRATQKYFRVMTRLGEEEAHLYVLVPTGLREMPILPIDLFGPSLREYDCGALFGRPGNESARAEPVSQLPSEVVRVRLRKRIVWSGALARPALDPADTSQVRAVVLSSPEFTPSNPPSLYRFRGLYFQHGLFRGRGDALMRWLGVAPMRKSYLEMLARLFPEGAGSYCVGGNFDVEGWCREDARHLLDAIASAGAQPCEGFAAGHRALCGHVEGRAATPEELLIRAQENEKATQLLWALPVHKRREVAWRFGLLGEIPMSQGDIACLEGVSSSLISLQLKQSLLQMSKCCRLGSDGTVVFRPPARGFRSLAPFRSGAPKPNLWSGGRPALRASWRPFRTPLPVSRLLGFLDRVLTEMDRSDAILRVSPAVDVEDRANPTRARMRWECGAECITVAYASRTVPGPSHDERCIDRLFCRFVTDEARTELMLIGSGQAFAAYHALGRIAERFMAACGLVESTRQES